MPANALWPIALLVVSNVFMTFAWYGHLKFKGAPLLTVIVIPVQLVLAVGMALLLQTRPRFASTHFYLWAVPLALKA